MAARQLPDRDVLRKLLDYDPKTGKLTWKVRDVEMFSHCRRSPILICAKWNKKHSGKETFTTVTPYGYKMGSVGGIKCLAHRVIWKWMTGEDPKTIDHINGNGLDNRFENLRNVDMATNSKNVAIHKSNKSGFTGVCWSSRSSRWRAYITVNDKQFYLGMFQDKRAAVAARDAANVRLGFHPNHGLRSRPN